MGSPAMRKDLKIQEIDQISIRLRPITYVAPGLEINVSIGLRNISRIHSCKVLVRIRLILFNFNP